MDVQRNCLSTTYFLPILVGAATAYAWPTLTVTEGEEGKDYCTYSILTFLRIRMKGYTRIRVFPCTVFMHRVKTSCLAA